MFTCIHTHTHTHMYIYKHTHNIYQISFSPHTMTTDARRKDDEKRKEGRKMGRKEYRNIGSRHEH